MIKLGDFRENAVFCFELAHILIQFLMEEKDDCCLFQFEF